MDVVEDLQPLKVIVDVDEWTSDPVTASQSNVGQYWFNPLLKKMFQCVAVGTGYGWKEIELQYGVFYTKQDDIKPYVFDGDTLSPIAKEKKLYLHVYPGNQADNKLIGYDRQTTTQIWRSYLNIELSSLSSGTWHTVLPKIQEAIPKSNIYKIMECSVSFSIAGAHISIPVIGQLKAMTLSVAFPYSLPPDLKITSPINAQLTITWRGSIWS